MAHYGKVSTVAGKALLTLELLSRKPHRNYRNFDIHVNVLTCSNPSIIDVVYDDFHLIEGEWQPAPNVTRKMRVGDKITVAVTYQFTHVGGAWGYTEPEVELVYKKERVIRRYKRRK